MPEPNTLTWVWAALIGSGVVVEIVTVAGHIRHGSLTWNVRHFVTGVYNRRYPRWLGVANRVLLGGFLAWLIVHFDLGWL